MRWYVAEVRKKTLSQWAPGRTEFNNFLEAEGIPHIYEEAAGNHDMIFWNKYVEKFIPVIFG